jgi:hypothetical protein
MDMDMAFCFFPLVGFARFGCGSCGFWFGLDGLDDPVWYLVYCFVLFCFACSTFLLRVGYLILLLFGMVAAFFYSLRCDATNNPTTKKGYSFYFYSLFLFPIPIPLFLFPRLIPPCFYIFTLTAIFAAKAAPATIVSLLFDAYICVCVHYALYLSYHTITKGVNGSILLYSVLL